MQEVIKKEWAIILNFESGSCDVLTLENRPDDIDADEFIETQLDYSLSNCQWMITREEPEFNFLN